MGHDIDALLFDMDGLLLDTERVFMDLAKDLLRPAGFVADEVEAFFLTLVGSSSASTQKRLNAFLDGRLDTQAFYADWYKHLEHRLSDSVPLRPTVLDALNAAERTKRPMVVVTSTRGRVARDHLRKAGLSDFFHHVLGGDEVSANKPDPAPYLEAAKLLGVDPQRCAAFEDSDRGIASAVAAGCRSVQIPDLRPPEDPLPDLGQHIASNLHDAMRDLGLI